MVNVIMIKNRVKLFIFCLTVSLTLTSLGHVLIVKEENSQQIALDALDVTNYRGFEWDTPNGDGNTILDIVLRYQWPTNLLFALINVCTREDDAFW